jgi:hypothetical protein
LGDFTGDGLVGIADLAILQAHLGIPSGATRLMGDMDGDGDVDRTDAASFARQFGRSTIAGIPSPAAWPPSSPLAVVRRAAANGPRLVAARRALSARGVDRLLAEQADESELSATASQRHALRTPSHVVRRRLALQ